MLAGYQFAISLGRVPATDGTQLHDRNRILCENYVLDASIRPDIVLVGSSLSANLPMTAIMDDCKRGLATLFLGEDLSTLSRVGQAIGASVQGEDRARRERGDCARIEETLNAAIDPTVIRWFFGDDAPILARLVIDVPVYEDRALLGNLVAQLVNLGAHIPVSEVARRLNVPTARAGDLVFQPPAKPSAPIAEPTAGTLAAFNADPA